MTLIAITVGCSSPSATLSPPPPPPLNGTIIFGSTPTGGLGQLVTMDPQGGSRHVLLSGAADYMHPAISPDGHKLAFSSNADGDYDIWVVNLDGTGLTQITGASAPDTLGDSHPSWSPDGTKIAFLRLYNFGTSGAQLFVVNADGTGESALTQVVTSGYLDSPSWSPDGTTIAFISGGTPRVWTMAADGSNAAPVPNTDSSFMVSWSPDGTRLAIASVNGITLVNPDGSNPFKVEPNGETGTDPAWSPDGKYLVYSRFYPAGPNGNTGISRVAIDGTGALPLTNGATAADYHPTWAP